ncbi:hypothetical protein R3P38DRAFT_3354839, partial [Favolaschia claudopus]
TLLSSYHRVLSFTIQALLAHNTLLVVKSTCLPNLSQHLPSQYSDLRVQGNLIQRVVVAAASEVELTLYFRWCSTAGPSSQSHPALDFNVRRKDRRYSAVN